MQPHQISDFLALVGDVSDDIPGVSVRDSSVLIEKLVHCEEPVKFAKKLATIVIDIPLIQSVMIWRFKD